MKEFLTLASKELATSLDYEKTIESLTKLVVPHLADWCSINLLEEDNTISLLTAASVIPHKKTSHTRKSSRLKVTTQTKGDMPSVIRTGKSLLFMNVSEEDFSAIIKSQPELSHIAKDRVSSMIIVPLKAKTNTFGSVTFLSTKQSNITYTEQELAIAEDFANLAAIALENSYLLKEAKESKLRYQHLFNGINEAVLIVGEDGRYLDANPAALKLLQRTKQELLQMKLGDLSKEGLVHNGDSFKTLQSTGSWQGEGYIPVSPTESIYVEGRASVIQLEDEVIYTLVLHDITQKKVAFEANAKLAAIVSSSQDAIFSRAIDGTIISWNKGAESIFGYTPEEIIGKHAKILVPKDRHYELEEIYNTLTKGGTWSNHDTQRIAKNGNIIDVSITLSPIIDSSGKVIAEATIARDITEIKALERRKDEFLSVASHELKTPITSIKAFAQVLEKYFSEDKDTKSYEIIKKMNRQVNKLSRLVYDLLDLSKIELGKLEYSLEPFDLDELILEIVEDIQALTKRHKLIYVHPTQQTINSDRYRLGQVLTNLINNAIKYSPDGGTITLSSEVKDDQVIVSVQDQGIGIPKSKQVKLFQRFYRVERVAQESYGGLGLGLYISKQIITKIGGKIWIDSRANKGTTFYFSLPLSKQLVN